MSDVTSSKRFFAALRRAGPPLRDSGVNRAAALREADESIRLAGRLQEYRQYLAQARAFKAERDGSQAIDAEVLAQGRQAAADAQALSTSMLRLVRSLENGGVLDRLSGSWHSAVRTVGVVNAEEEWDRLLASDQTAELFREAGVSEDLVTGLTEGLRGTGIEVRVEELHVVATGTMLGRPATALLDSRPRPRHPRNVIDLLTSGRFTQLVAMAESGQPVFLEGVGIADSGQAHLTDIALYGALATHREAVRHVRKLEDTGLATYQGGGPAVPIIVVIALISLAIGTAMMLYYCKDDDPNNPKTTGCTIGVFLTFIGAILLYLKKDHDQNNPTGSSELVMGSPVVRGILRDVRAAPA